MNDSNIYIFFFQKLAATANWDSSISMSYKETESINLIP